MAAIVFDLDGTLVNSSECILASIDFAFSTLGHQGIPYDRVAATQQDLGTSFRRILSENSIPFVETELRSFIDHYRRYHTDEAEDLIQPYEGVAEVLEFLAPHFQLAVATTKHTSQACRVLQRQKLNSFFNHVQGTDPGLRYKPEPDILYATLRALNKPSGEAVYVGDSLHDMHAAEASGMKSMGAAYGFAGDQALRNHGPDWLIYDIRDFLKIREDVSGRLGQVLAVEATA